MIHDAIMLLWDYPIRDWPNPNQDMGDYTGNLSEPEKKIFLRIMEVARTHALIKRFIEKYSLVSGEHLQIYKNKYVYARSGLYMQALSEGLDEILEPYRRHLVELQKSTLSNPYLPLSYLLASVEEFKFLFNTLSKILFSIKEKRLIGCQILEVVQHYSTTGNKETTKALQRLLHIVHRVFYDQLCRWILYGDLKDEKKEFIIIAVEKILSPSPTLNLSEGVSVNSYEYNNSSRKVVSEPSSTKIDYEINSVMIPSYIPLSLVEKILFIGRSVVLFDSNPLEMKGKSSNFSLIEINFNKRFTIWGEKERVFHKTLQELKTMEIFEIHRLDILIDEIKSCVTEHLWIIADEEAGLMHEIQLMKDFFLLGRGELFLEFLRLVTPLFNSRSVSPVTRDINQAFQSAARAVFLGNNKDIEKFSFLISSNQCLTDSFISTYDLDDWSTITLKYNVKWPLHLIFTPEILHQYNELFKFLLRLKKTQHDLHLMWYSFRKTRRFGNPLWQLHNKLMFLMDHLQLYLQADVLESSYSKLKNEAENIKDFELLKVAHSTFLIEILSQSFLLINMPSNNDSDNDSSSDHNMNPVLCNIIELLQLCDVVCSLAHNEKSQNEQRFLLINCTQRFETLVKKLLQLLAALQAQPCGTHLARLLMRLDFNRWFSSTAQLTQSVSHML